MLGLQQQSPMASPSPDLALALISFGGYFAASHVPDQPAYIVPETALDRLIPLIPASVFPYLSLYPFLGLNAAYFWPQPVQARRVFWAISLLNGLGSMLFCSVRTSVPRPEPATNRLLAWLWRVDPPYNALPSLHTAYAVVLAEAHWRLRSRWRWLVAAWALAIIISTLTTKQHRLWDVLAGMLLARMVAKRLFADFSAKHQL
ncbi:phosphatase PAP2 family protein [Herpetosiphon sp. NSE202]|uniref:phosphatase PAP2 family protein n=1 Tax=Herpetosiphon sp. NSE202 TaxID=3351349 RepID=UPI00363A99C9